MTISTSSLSTNHQPLTTNSLIIHTDGGSRGNPGPAATGIVVLQNNQELHAFGKFLGVATNNEAEYTAVIDALNWLIATQLPSYPATQLMFKLDSKLVVEQLNGHWKIKEPRLQTLNSKILLLISQNQLKVDFDYVPRAENWQADREVNKVLDSI